MNERKTWDEMRSEFPEEWLLITDIEKDEYGNFESGIVIQHSTDQDAIYQFPLLDKPTATFYTGESSFSGLRSHVQIPNSI
jgi:hypothetical protein